MRIVLLDHEDSFTLNLAHDLGVACGAMPRILSSFTARVEDVLLAEPVDLLVLSAGPGRPDHPTDAGISLEVLAAAPAGLPIFGVCFGLQLVTTWLGGTVTPAREVVHGKPVPIHHQGGTLFRGLPSPVSMMRYNSLVAAAAGLPEMLRIDATGKGGEIMAISHRERPIWAVQFHPESVGSPLGKHLLQNLVEAVQSRVEGPRKNPGEVAHPLQESASPGEIAARA